MHRGRKDNVVWTTDFSMKAVLFQNAILRGGWLAQWGEHVTLDLGVMGSSPTLGIEIPLKNTILRGRLGGTAVKRLPSAQGVIPALWDRAPHQAPLL